MRRLLSVLVVVVAVAVAAAVTGCGVLSSEDETEKFTQGGVSMEPTIRSGQEITVHKVGKDYTPKHGDVVLFHADGGKWGGTGLPFLKRVIAVEGETVECCDQAGKILVNGKPLDEPYVTKNAPLDETPSEAGCGPRRFASVAVGPGTVFVMGDNRAASNDSRCAGPIPVSSVFAVMTAGQS